jgi:thiamine-phosphate pyrophosphorylase
MKKKILKGVYIVIDPLLDKEKMLSRLAEIRNENIAAIQIWDNPKADTIEPVLIEKIIELFSYSSTPVLINNKWKMLKEFDLDGVHFDTMPNNFKEIQDQVSRPFLKGLTLQNDLKNVQLFNELDFDYLSFCSLFPSATAIQCEMVAFDTIEKCRELTAKPIFLAGGIDLENIELINHLPADGIAVVSSIMNDEHPLQKLKQFNKLLKF